MTNRYYIFIIYKKICNLRGDLNSNNIPNGINFKTKGKITMGIGISLRGLKNKFNELMGRDKGKKENKKLSESLESKEETRFDDTSPTKSKKTTVSTDLDNTKNGASSGSVNSGEVHVEGLGQTTPTGSVAPQTNPSTGSGPSMLSPNSSTKRSRRLPPPPLPQNFSDPKCQKWVIEKFLKGDLSKLIDEAKKKRLLDDSYNYNENIKCYGFDYPACKFLENVRVFWLKIAEIIYSKIEEIPSNDISYEIINFQNQIGNCLQRTEMQSLLSKDDFVNKSKEFLKAINEKIDGVSGEKLLEDKKSELIKSKEVVEKANEKAASLESKKSEIITKESNRFNALVDKYCKVTGTNYEIENNNMSEFYNSISDFWSKCVKEELKITDSKRADKLNSAMINIDKEILKNGNKLDEIPDDERLVSLEEALDQKFNIIGRVVLYLEKRKNKENEKGFFGKLFGKSKKSDDETKSDESNKSKEELKEEKKQKKEKLNNQKRLKKCFEDMGKYFVKHKDVVSATGLRKLVKNNIKTYEDWSRDLCVVLGKNLQSLVSEGVTKELLISILFISFIDLGDKESVIAACDGLKEGKIKNGKDDFINKAAAIRKAIKGKCSIDIGKDDLKDSILSLCVKHELLKSRSANDTIASDFKHPWNSANAPKA